jgi:histidinol-phosphate aminotransferase
MIQTRSCLEKLHDYTPGKSIEEVAEKHGLQKVVKLASNENPMGVSPKVQEAINEISSKVHLYPVGHSPKLANAVARELDLQNDQLIFTNGSDEAIWLICTAFLNPGEKVLSSVETFSEYEFCAQLLDGQYNNVPLNKGEFDLNAILEAITPQTKMVFLCTPNNPTGTIVRAKEFEKFFAKVPKEVLVVVDQAYAEYVNDPEYPQLLKRLARESNLMVLRTFSKVYGLAGLRVGYAMAAPKLIKQLLKVKQPFNVNLLAQHAALAAFKDKTFLQASLTNNQLGKQRLEKLFAANSIEYYKSHTNFIAFKMGPKAGEFAQYCESKGLILRHLKSFELPEYIRVTIGLPKELDLFEELLTSFLES